MIKTALVRLPVVVPVVLENDFTTYQSVGWCMVAGWPSTCALLMLLLRVAGRSPAAAIAPFAVVVPSADIGMG